MIDIFRFWFCFSILANCASRNPNFSFPEVIFLNKKIMSLCRIGLGTFLVSHLISRSLCNWHQQNDLSRKYSLQSVILQLLLKPQCGAMTTKEM